MLSPTPQEIKAWRESAGLTQAQAAALIGYTARAWENWEQGIRPMRPVLFNLARRPAAQDHGLLDSNRDRAINQAHEWR